MYKVAVANDHDLKEIIKLQEMNLKSNLSPNEIISEGFVTVKHDLPLLAKMNSLHPHTIVKHHDVLVGYALTMLPSLREEIEILEPMFDIIDNCTFNGKELKELRYCVMGQICIAKAHRGKGLFSSLYRGMKVSLAAKFEVIITEVDEKNQRSLKAHRNFGFELICSYKDKGITWHLIGIRI